jgi:hypothetical protein
MKALKFIALFIAFPIFGYGLIYALYMYKPEYFHYKANRLFIEERYAEASIEMYESGDSARKYLIQRYVQKNRFSTNAYGSRTACYQEDGRKKPSVLALGDSQMLGSSTDDSGVFTSHLCKKTSASIFNAAVRGMSANYGLGFLRNKDMIFDVLLFTTTERAGFNKTYCSSFDKFEQLYDTPLKADEMIINSKDTDYTYYRNIHNFVIGYLQSRMRAILDSVKYGLTAPEKNIIAFGHVFKDDVIDGYINDEINCAKRLQKFFASKGFVVGFLYFPAHQTIYGTDVNLTPPPSTLNFIDTITEKFSKEGLKTFNSKSCLLVAKKREPVYQPHDSHLNHRGFEVLAECLLDNAVLKKLFNQ